jgi:peptide/nickel transport system substrate-binding protein
MKRDHRRAGAALAVVAALVMAACSGADAPNTAPSTTGGGTESTGATGSTTAGSTDTTAPAEEGPAGVKPGADTILTPAPTQEKDSAVWAVYRETSTIDPIFVFDYPDNAAMAIACESLLRQNPDLTIGPGLATTVEYTSPTSLVITLRDDVNFWDGTPMTAADVVFSLNRQKDPANGGFYGSVFVNVTAIEATGDHEVTITTSKQDMALLGELSGPVGAVVQQKTVEEQGANFGTAAGTVMCTGPFKLASWKVGEGVTFERNDAYWDKTLPMKLKSITIKGVSDEATSTAGILTGEIDGGYPIISSTLDQLRASDAVNVYEGPGYGISAFIVSNFDGALKDKRVRQALSMALDRQGLVDALYKGAAYPARAVAVPGTWGYAKDVFTKAWNELPDVSKPDVEAAKQLVKDAGAEGQTVRIGMSSELNALNVTAGEIQRALESIGMKAELVSLSAAAYITFFIDPKAREGVDGFLTTNYPNYADPLGIYATMIGPDGSQAYNGFSDPAAVALVDEARSEPDDTKRAEKVVELQKIITDEMLWVPLVAPTNVLVMNKSITGAPSTFQYMFGPWAAYLGAP